MSNSNETFAYSLTVSEFKQRHNVNEISVKQVPGRESKFWTAGELSGPVSSKIESFKESDIQMAVTHEGICIMSKAGTGVDTIATL